MPNVRDILQLIDQVEGKIELPSFVVTNYNSLPPSNFDSLAPVLCSLRDEITTLREEVSQLRKLNQELSSAQVGYSCMQHDLSDLKLMVRNLSSKRGQQKMSYSDNAAKGNNSNGPGQVAVFSGSPRRNEAHSPGLNRTLSVAKDNLTLPNSQPSVIPKVNVNREDRVRSNSSSFTT